MLDRDQLETIQERPGLHFSNTELLEEAFTHAYGNATKCNERLEFWGDKVLQYYVSVDVHTRYEDFQDGDLTKTRSKIVDKSMCYCLRFLQVGESIQCIHYWTLEGGGKTTSGFRLIHVRYRYFHPMFI